MIITITLCYSALLVHPCIYSVDHFLSVWGGEEDVNIISSLVLTVMNLYLENAVLLVAIVY